jgi:hypothetical protein
LDSYSLFKRRLLDRHNRVAGIMIPDRYLAEWAERQADYVAEYRRLLWLRENMPELIDEGENW